MVSDIEELEEMDATEIHAGRLNAQEVLTPDNGEKFIFPIADGTDGSSPIPHQDSSLHDGKAGNRRRENCDKVEADAELGFEDCSHLNYSAEFECIKSFGDTQRAPSQQGSNLIASAGKFATGVSNQNDAASSSQVWLSDAKTNDSARRLAAAGTSQDLSFQESARKLAA